MKFKDMKYERPDFEKIKAEITKLTEELQKSGNYEQARSAFLKEQELLCHVMTAAELVSIRHSIDTRDKFYDDEQKLWNSTMPQLEEYLQQWNLTLLKSPFRPQFEEEYGKLMFTNGEIQLRTFVPEMIPMLQEENQLADDYESLLASAQIPFEGQVYTLSQMEPFMNDPDDERRLCAWKATGRWYKENQTRMDGIYDKLVHLRTDMSKMLGNENYLPLGYDRMTRNCYTKEDIARFREAVIRYLVPVASEIYKEQAKRLGKEYPMSPADCALAFRSGNPKPAGTPGQILEQGRVFYTELSPETEEFFNHMLDNGMLDVLSTEGKASGGYCTEIVDYKTPFIFANFNGTDGDIGVITHEAGHAFEVWMNRDRIPVDYHWPSMEACEVHSMSMEFFAWPWTDGFFGDDSRKYLYTHLAGAIKFIPYGTVVDHFQHSVYENPDWTPRQRHDEWKRLLGIYMPWIRLDGEIPFFSEGEDWQLKHHIYSSPLYYIDYCLAQTVALEFWSMIQEDVNKAWDKYMTYTVLGGSKTFTELLADAGLVSPFDEECLKKVCADAGNWLKNYDLTGIE